ncbi:hypothetical protein CJJ09_004893 [Candidozyma auris]|nr:hypothetical protein CJJ09_004893 [[Candida] auris]
MPHSEEFYLDRLTDSRSINETRAKNAQAWKNLLPEEEFCGSVPLAGKVPFHEAFRRQNAQVNVWTDSYEHIASEFQKVEPKYFGLRLDCPSSGKHIGFIVWTYDFDYCKDEQKYHNHATVLKIHVNTPDFDRDTYALQLLELAKGYLESPHEEEPLKNFTTLVVWSSSSSSRPSLTSRRSLAPPYI